MTSVAIFRYIVVCHPVFSKQPVFAKVRKFINILITIFTLVAIITNASYVAYHFEPYDPLKTGICGQTFFKSDRQKSLVEGIAFFSNPSCCVFDFIYFCGKKFVENVSNAETKPSIDSSIFVFMCDLGTILDPRKAFWLSYSE